MEFEFHYLSKDEADYINRLVGCELEKEGNSVICSVQKKIYSLYLQFGHPDPDYNRETIELIIYNKHLIRLQSRLVKGGVSFSRIFVPRSLKIEEDRIIEIIKEIQILEATGKGGDPRQTVVEYPNGIPIVYYEDTNMIPNMLLWGIDHG